jgi:hypothetical protein
VLIGAPDRIEELLEPLPGGVILRHGNRGRRAHLRSGSSARDGTSIREVVLPRGMVDSKVCAIDETWSGLRLTRRRS